MTRSASGVPKRRLDGVYGEGWTGGTGVIACSGLSSTAPAPCSVPVQVGELAQVAEVADAPGAGRVQRVELQHPAPGPGRAAVSAGGATTTVTCCSRGLQPVPARASARPGSRSTARRVAVLARPARRAGQRPGPVGAHRDRARQPAGRRGRPGGGQRGAPGARGAASTSSRPSTRTTTSGSTVHGPPSAAAVAGHHAVHGGQFDQIAVHVAPFRPGAPTRRGRATACRRRARGVGVRLRRANDHVREQGQDPLPARDGRGRRC